MSGQSSRGENILARVKFPGLKNPKKCSEFRQVPGEAPGESFPESTQKSSSIKRGQVPFPLLGTSSCARSPCPNPLGQWEKKFRLHLKMPLSIISVFPLPGDGLAGGRHLRGGTWLSPHSPAPSPSSSTPNLSFPPSSPFFFFPPPPREICTETDGFILHESLMI